MPVDVTAIEATVVGMLGTLLGLYALVSRCLRDSAPEQRPEILRALADVVRGPHRDRRVRKRRAGRPAPPHR